MEEKIKILLAEDDTNLGMLLKEYLRAKGFRDCFMQKMGR